jgi:Protein of unknown function (DUF3768)
MTNADSAQPSKEQNRNIPEDQPPEATAAIPAKVARIRDLNDKLRTTQRGGMVLITDGLAALGQEAGAILDAVTGFTNFNPDNDPWGEHDCASLEVNGHRVIWKIDYYDRSRRIHSPDPADPKVTVRVLTVMLASEY